MESTVQWERLVTPQGVVVYRGGPTRARAGVVLLGHPAGEVGALRTYGGRLVERGYAVVMPDLWWRSRRPSDGEGNLPDAAETALSDPEALMDVAAARLLLATGRAPVFRCFAMGFSEGGLYARMAACALPGFTGAVEFYGRLQYAEINSRKPLQPLDLLPGLNCPLQAHFGDRDVVAPPVHVDELQRRLALRTRPSQVFRYAGCAHGFLDPGRPSYRRAEAETAWARACNFLEQLSPDGR